MPSRKIIAGKPLQGPFSQAFYSRLRAERIKPRRLNKPKGPERFTFSVANPNGKWKRDLYYDPRALANLDDALRQFPHLRKPLMDAFEHTIEHELVHEASSKDYQAFPARKIIALSEARERDWEERLLPEQVANRGIVAKIMRENGLKSLSSPKAVELVSDKLSWQFVMSLIQAGELKRVAKEGIEANAPKSRKALGARQLLARMHLRQLFPKLPQEIINETVRKMRVKFTRLAEQVEAKFKENKGK